MAVNLSLPPMALISEPVARAHAERLRNLASIFVLAELQSSEMPAPSEMIKAIEEIAVQFESAVQFMPSGHDPAAVLRAAGAM